MKTELSWQTRLPKKSGRYVVVTDFTVVVLDYSNKHRTWNVRDVNDEWVALKNGMNKYVNAWADLDVNMLVNVFKKEEN